MNKQTLAILMTDAQNNPGDPRLQFDLIKATRNLLPSWHLPMLYDQDRNDFYKEMIQKHVAGKTVLEIGTGTGFLALLAARAGAKHIYACEMNPLFQHLSEQAIAASPYASKITIIPKESTKLEIGTDLPEKVDVVVSEILSTDVFSESMIPYLRDIQRLVKPNAIFLPSMIEVWACLVEPNNTPQDKPTALTEPLEFLVQRLPKFNYARLKLVSEQRKIAEVKNGIELDHTPPWKLKFKRTKSSAQTSLCISFRLIDGTTQLTSFPHQSDDPKGLLHADSWGQMIYPLTPNRENYALTLHLLEEQHLVVTEHL